MTEAQSQEQKAVDELAKLKDNRDVVANKLEKSSLLVVELREAVIRAKTFIVEKFKSSLEFFEAVEDAASKYFGEGFDFFRR